MIPEWKGTLTMGLTVTVFLHLLLLKDLWELRRLGLASQTLPEGPLLWKGDKRGPLVHYTMEQGTRGTLHIALPWELWGRMCGLKFPHAACFCQGPRDSSLHLAGLVWWGHLLHSLGPCCMEPGWMTELEKATVKPTCSDSVILSTWRAGPVLSTSQNILWGEVEKITLHFRSSQTCLSKATHWTAYGEGDYPSLTWHQTEDLLGVLLVLLLLLEGTQLAKVDCSAAGCPYWSVVGHPA